MIICSNCGATNSETEGSICRKCGALLPVAKSSRRHRIEMPSNEDNEIKIISTEKINSNNNNQSGNNIPIELRNNPEAQIFHSRKEKNNSRGNQFELQEIPLSDDLSIEPLQNDFISGNDSEGDVSAQETLTTEGTMINQIANEKIISLPEIKPQPYQGSILSSAPSIIKPASKPSNSKSNVSIPKIKPLPTKKSPDVSGTNPKTQKIEKSINTDGEDYSVKKQKQLDLEQDMIEVLKFLSKKLSLPNKTFKTSKKVALEEEIEEKMHPSSLNEILKSLLSMNQHIEAATLLRTDGTILAAAISTRISDSLLATIGQNLLMIGTDIIHGLSAGDLKSISIRGTDGTLDVAPLNRNTPVLKDMLLMIFSDPKVRSGVISFSIKQIEKLVIEFFNIK